MIGYWPELRELIGEFRVEVFPCLKELVHSWSYPEMMGRVLVEKVALRMRMFARQMLKDISEMADGHQGILRWVKTTANRLGFRIGRIELERDYEILFPADRGDYPCLDRLRRQPGKSCVPFLVPIYLCRRPLRGL